MEQEASEEYSFGVICRCKNKYLVYCSSKKIWVFHKGHYEEEDTKIVTPYDDIEVVPIDPKCRNWLIQLTIQSI